jgi:hypothetical protein
MGQTSTNMMVMVVHMSWPLPCSEIQDATTCLTYYLGVSVTKEKNSTTLTTYTCQCYKPGIIYTLIGIFTCGFEWGYAVSCVIMLMKTI